MNVRKIEYLVSVNVVNGVPQCPYCQDPMVERSGGWMCATGAAVLDVLTERARSLDEFVGVPPAGEVPDHG